MFHNISYANPDSRTRPFDDYLGLADLRPPLRVPTHSLQARGSPVTTKVRKLEPRTAPARLDTPTDLSAEGVREISAALNALIADTFALYAKTKNFHWHVSGPHFRDYHLLLDDQGDQLAASIDVLAERARKVGGTTIRSIGHIAKLQRIRDNDKNYVPAIDMLLELMNDNKARSTTCARPTRSPTSTRTWRPPAFWRISLTKRKNAAGSCSRRAARPSGPATRTITPLWHAGRALARPGTLVGT